MIGVHRHELRLPTYSGVYDHEALRSEYVTITHLNPLGTSDCRRIWEKGKKVWLGNRPYNIQLNSTTCPGKGETFDEPKAHQLVGTRYTTNVEPMALSPIGEVTTLCRQTQVQPDRYWHRTILDLSGMGG